MAIKKHSEASFLSRFGWWVSLIFLFALGWGALVPGIGSKFIKPCANSISCIQDLTGTYQFSKESVFMGKKVSSPTYLAENLVPQRVLGETTTPKHIYVDLSTQTLGAYEGDKLVLSFPVSTGKWRKTPTGDFRIWIKLRNAHMEGGSGADYYNLYNVPYTMFFYNDEIDKGRGFSLHGAYWHNNFGYPMSHGCVNIRPEDAEKLYSWADPPTRGTLTYATDSNLGTLVTIYGQTPDE